jgi:hypothetical protein
VRRAVLKLRQVAVMSVVSAVGLAGGGAAGLVAQRPSRPPLPQAEGVLAPKLPAVRPITPDTLLAWTSGGLPAGFGRAVSRLPGVEHVVGVVSGTAWLDRSFDAAGALVDRPPDGLAFPLEVAAASPSTYSPFLAPADRAILSRIARGQAALGTTSARLRGLGAGALLRFGSHRIRVAGMLPDAAVGAQEVFVSRETAASLGLTRERYLLIDPGAHASRVRLTRRIRALLPAGVPLQMRGPGETPFFRQGDAVLPPIELKELFGEFAARPQGGLLRIDPRWVASHIVTASVPILGSVRCNRALIPKLRGALEEIQREGLSQLLPRGDFAGCFSPRFINTDPRSAGISHHSWGVAVDVNVSANPFGATPHQDPRVVAVFERWGFTWGGRWIRPDGMHFEFIRFPSGG